MIVLSTTTTTKTTPENYHYLYTTIKNREKKQHSVHHTTSQIYHTSLKSGVFLSFHSLLLARLASAFASYQTRPSFNCCGLSEKVPGDMNSGLPPRPPPPPPPPCIIWSGPPGCCERNWPCSLDMGPKSPPPIGIGPPPWSMGPPANRRESVKVCAQLIWGFTKQYPKLCIFIKFSV